MVEVTQEDREAAAMIYQRFRDYDYARWIMDGTNAMGDHDSVIQAFAAHRIAAEKRGAEKMRERAAEVADDHASHAWEIGRVEGQNGICSSGRNYGARAVAQAVRAILKEKM